LSAARVNLTVKNGIVLVGSDGHYWPGEASTAHRAFVQFAKKLNPVAVIINGDSFDGASISRHPSGWEANPTVKQELESVQERHGEIEAAAPKARKIWTLGNHDQRFELRLATVAREYANVDGMHLKDHFPRWEPCWSVWINDEIVVKHRYKGGTHAGYNNAVSSGKTMVTGHLHSLKVTPFTDYNGLRWGVDTGCLSDPRGDQFAYGEDNPRDHRSGFICLQFRGGKLMWPEIVYVLDRDHVGFRGEIIKCERQSTTARATASRRSAATSRATTKTSRKMTSRLSRSTARGRKRANDRS
jgi:hypothetical protein